MTDATKPIETTNKTFSLYEQASVNYVPVSATAGRACAGCRWFKTYGSEYTQQDECHLVQSWPNAIEPTGLCDRYEEGKPEAYEPTPMPVVIVEAEDAEKEAGDETPVTRKSVRQLIVDVLAGVFTPESGEPQSGGFKVLKSADGVPRWVGWWSNNFRDREGEFFTEKAIDDYIARVDLGLVPMPALWHWHTPGTKHGQADWLGRIDHMVVASGTFDDSPLGQAAAKAYASGKQRYGMSHGFTYDKRYKRDGVYHQFNTFEVTTLPPPVAANAFTDFEGVKSMTLTQEKRESLEKLFGKDKAAELIAETEAKSKALEELGVEFKDFAHVDGEGEAAKEAVANAEKNITDLLPELMEGSGLAVQASLEAVKQGKALKALVEAQAEEIKSLRVLIGDRPRSASKDQATELTPERLKEMLENVDKQSKTIDSFWGTEVSAEA